MELQKVLSLGEVMMILLSDAYEKTQIQCIFSNVQRCHVLRRWTAILCRSGRWSSLPCLAEAA
jgi:hypothetical protein